MKFYKEIQRIILPRSTIQKAQDFANAVTDTTNYSDSNQNTRLKIINDHFVSKLGEEAAWLVFHRYTSISPPDYAIYPLKEKSWKHDLFSSTTGFAVKTQKRSAAKKYSLSWTFQCGALRSDPILHQPKSWVIFVEFDDLSAGAICYVYPPFQIEELLFQDPVLHYLKNHKKVVYANTLKL
jgi:hypothetical protein